MSASSKRPPDTRPPAAGEQGLAGRPWLRRAIGAGLLLHLVAVAVAPFAVLVAPHEEPPGGGPPRPGTADREAVPASDDPVIGRLEKGLFRPYLNLLYLNHGYSFFAPEPGPSYIMEYEVHRQDGSVVRGRLPDLEEQWPRLLYHRYFMLATQNWELVVGAAVRGKVPAGSTNTLAYAILRHVMELHDAERGVLRLYRHRLLWPEEVVQGESPEDPETYVFLDEISLPPKAGEPEVNGASEKSAPAEEVPQ